MARLQLGQSLNSVRGENRGEGGLQDFLKLWMNADHEYPVEAGEGGIWQPG